MNTLGIWSSEQDGGITERVIESVTQIVNDPTGYVSQFRGYSLAEAEFQQLVSGLSFTLPDDLVSARLDEGVASCFEIKDAVFAAIH